MQFIIDMTGFHWISWSPDTIDCDGPVQMIPLPTMRVTAETAMIMVMLALLSCQPRNGLLQETLPSESAVVEILGIKIARVRSISCDIMVEPVNAEGWDRLAKASVYRRAGPGPVVRRIPPVAAFLVILKNTVNAPIRLAKTRIICSGTTMELLTAETIITRFRSPSYSWLDFGRLLSFRRLVAEPESLAKIDFDRDTIETRLDFIPPQDTVIIVTAFDRIPVEFRKFKLLFTIAAMGATRDIAVEFNRNEYPAGDKKIKKAETDYDEY